MSGGDKKDTGEDPYANSGARFGRLELPAFDARSLDLGAIAPLYGVQSEHEADYLDYNIKGRDWFEKCTYNCGLGYLGGIISGGVYGAVEGNRAAPSSRAKIRVNSILNASGKRGSRLGNGLAVLGLYYTTAEHLLDRYEVDKYLGGEDWINPILAAGSTGMLYKCTAGPRTMALAGAVGIMGMGAVIASQTLLGSLGSGQRSRSRA